MASTSRGRQEFQVGLVVIIAVAVLVAGLLYLQEIRLGSDNLDIRVHLSSVGGLGAGDPVHVRGIPLGKVKEIELVEGGVIVHCHVDGRVILREDAIIQVSSVGLVGERIVAMDPGTGEIVADPTSKLFEGVYELSMPELAGQMASLGDRFGEFLTRLEETLDDIESQGGVGGAISEATRAARNLADYMETNEKALRDTARNTASITRRVDSFLDAHADSAGVAMDQMPAMMARTDSLLQRLDRVAMDAELIMASISDTTGVVGKLILDEALGNSVETSILEVQKLVEDIRRNPQRYLNLTLMQF